MSVTKFAEGKKVAEIQPMVTTYLPSPVFDEKTRKSNLVDYFVASVMAQRTAGHKNLDVSRDARDSPSWKYSSALVAGNAAALQGALAGARY